jgi:serine/threonine protein kinase
MHESQPTFPVGSIIRGRFTVVDLLGWDTSGASYLVRDKRNQQNSFVLKEVVHSHTADKDQNRLSFNRALLKRLKHPALPRIYQIFYRDKHSRAYILMDHIEGRDLAAMQQQLPEKRASLSQAISLMSPIIDAVSYLHRQQPPLIHGNITPSNIMMPEAGLPPVLIDFVSASESGSSTTRTTQHERTLNYYAPEQYNGRTGVRADIYALGAIFYTLLSGSMPVAASQRLDQLAQNEPDPLVPVNQIEPSVPTTVALAIQRAMSIHTHDRYPTVEQFWEAVWQVIYDSTIVTPVPQLSPAVPIEELQTFAVPIEELQVPGQENQAPVAENFPAATDPVMPQITEPEDMMSAEETPLLMNPPTQTGVDPMLISATWPFPPASYAERKRPVLVSMQEKLDIYRFKKFRLLLLLALIVSFAAIFWLYSPVSHHTEVAIPTAGSLKSTPDRGVSTGTAIAGPTSIPYPHAAGLYQGTIYDILDNTTTKMTLTAIQQEQGNITGYFTGLHSMNHFHGTISTAKHIHLIATGDAGKPSISFDGEMLSDGSLAGSYCVANQSNQSNHCSNYGIWSVFPQSAKPSS